MELVLGWLAMQALAALALFWYFVGDSLTNFGAWLMLTVVGTVAGVIALPLVSNALLIGWAAQAGAVLLSWLAAWSGSRH